MLLAKKDLMKKSLLIVFVSLVIFGCRNHIEKAAKNITPYGLDTYTIAYSGDPYATVRTIVYKAANQHCEKQEKLFLLQSEGPKTSDSRASVELVFRCLLPDDPEYIRPTVEPPDTVIEDRRTK